MELLSRVARSLFWLRVFLFTWLALALVVVWLGAAEVADRRHSSVVRVSPGPLPSYFTPVAAVLEAGGVRLQLRGVSRSRVVGEFVIVAATATNLLTGPQRFPGVVAGLTTDGGQVSAISTVSGLLLAGESIQVRFVLAPPTGTSISGLVWTVGGEFPSVVQAPLP